MKTFVAKPAEVVKKWILIDADGLVVGRLAALDRHSPERQAQSRSTRRTSIAATTSSSSMRRRSVFTGRKYDDKVYHWHTGYPGGIKERTPRQILEGKFPERVVEKAVERMLQRGPLQRQLMRNLKVYKGAEHPHDAQNPETLDVAKLNRKNARA